MTAGAALDLRDDVPAEAVAAALRVYDFLRARNWHDDALVGPDCGVRLNYRLGRFVKSYLSILPWHDDLYYLQAQGYWILASLELERRTGDGQYGEIGIRCAEGILRRQLADGSWPYPNPEWRGRVATAEGTWGSLGLLDAFRRTGAEALLDGAARWHRYVETSIGFSDAPGGIAVNYFSGSSEAVPNNAAFYLRFLAELAAATGDDSVLERADGLVGFLREAQSDAGEFPYSVDIGTHRRKLEHFQCYQYNAFQCLDLMRYVLVSRDERALPLIERVLPFLRRALTPQGAVAYQCGHRRPSVVYHGAVVAAALCAGAGYGAGEYAADAATLFRWVISRQRPDGSFGHSEGDYGVLSDRRCYPRGLAMIACHLLTADRAVGTVPAAGGAGRAEL